MNDKSVIVEGFITFSLVLIITHTQYSCSNITPIDKYFVYYLLLKKI